MSDPHESALPADVLPSLLHLSTRIDTLDQRITTIDRSREPPNGRAVADLQYNLDALEKRIAELAHARQQTPVPSAEINRAVDSRISAHLAVIREEITAKLGGLMKGLGTVLKDEKQETADRIDSTLARAQASAELARGLARQDVEVAASVVTAHTLTLTATAIPQKDLQWDRRVKASFSTIDRAADTVTPQHEPLSDRLGDLLSCMASRAAAPVPPVEAQLREVEDRAQDVLSAVSAEVAETIKEADAAMSIAGHIRGIEPLSDRLPPAVRSAALRLAMSAQAGHDPSATASKVENACTASLSRLSEIETRLLPLWTSATAVALASFRQKALGRLAERAPELRPMAKSARLDYSVEVERHRQEHPRPVRGRLPA